MALSHETLHRSDELLPKAYSNDFIDQGKNPPGGDIVMGACYQATSKLLEDDSIFNKNISSIVNKRPLTPSHFTNLYFRSIQYLELFRRNNPNYPANFTNFTAWTEEIQEISDKHGDYWKELLLKKDTTTTIFQRYAGSKIVLNALFPGKSLRIADFGCGGNYGLPGLSKGMSFDDIVDQTPSALPTKLIAQNMNLEKGLAVDRENPYTEDARSWRLACSFYPQELDTMPQLVAFEQQLQDVENVSFLQGDLLQLQVNHANGTLPRRYFDAVLLSTMLYQMTPHEQNRVLQSARASLSKNGVLIIQDFAKKDQNDPSRLDFNVNWFEKPFNYRTFVAGRQTDWKMQEALQWQNGRCKQVKPGEDFDKIF